MMRYYKLFDLLNRRNMKKTDLLCAVSAPTLAKLGKGDSVTTDVLCKICGFLHCQPGDIMEYVPEDTTQAPEMPHTAAKTQKADKSPSKAETTPHELPAKAEKKYKPFTEEDARRIDFEELACSVAYQLDIGLTFGEDVLSELMGEARKREAERNAQNKDQELLKEAKAKEAKREETLRKRNPDLL